MSMPQIYIAELWKLFNNLCAWWLGICVVAGAVKLAQAFAMGVAVSALMSLLHLSIAP